MSEQLPPELLSRCRAIDEGANQGEALRAVDYAWFALVTVVIPAVIVAIGVML